MELLNAKCGMRSAERGDAKGGAKEVKVGKQKFGKQKTEIKT